MEQVATLALAWTDNKAFEGILRRILDRSKHASGKVVQHVAVQRRSARVIGVEADLGRLPVAGVGKGNVVEDIRQCQERNHRHRLQQSATALTEAPSRHRRFIDQRTTSNAHGYEPSLPPFSRNGLRCSHRRASTECRAWRPAPLRR